MKKLVFAVAAAMVVVAEAETTTYTWNGVSTAYGETVTVAYDGNGKVTELTSSVPKHEKVVFVGDPVEFAADARIRITDGGQFVFSNDVVTAGALTADGCVTNVVLTVDPPIAAGNAVLYPDCASPEAYTPVSGTYSYNGGTTYANIGAYFTRRHEDGSVTTQIQHDDGGTLRVTLVKIVETEEGLVVSNVAQRSMVTKDLYDKRQNGVWDLETPEGAAKLKTVMTRSTLKGLKLNADRFIRSGRTVEFAGGLTAGGKISVSKCAEVILDGKTIGAEFAVPYDVSFGTMTFRDYGSFTNRATVSGKNGLVAYEQSDFTGDFTADDYVASCDFENDGLGTAETVVLPNTSLASITNVTGTVEWIYYTSSHSSDGTSTNLRAVFRKLGDYAIVQFKAIPPNRKSIAYCVIVRLDQRGRDVVARKVAGYRSWHENNPLSKDPWTWPLDSSGMGTSEIQYMHVLNMTFQTTVPVGHFDATSAFVYQYGTHATTNVSMSITPGLNRDTTLMARAFRSLPNVQGEIHVWNRATLSLDYFEPSDRQYGLFGLAVDAPTLCFHPGSYGLTKHQKTNAFQQTIELDDAEYYFIRARNSNGPEYSTPDYRLCNGTLYNVVYGLVYANGARTTGAKTWLGVGNSYSKVAVTGSSPSFCEGGLCICSENGKQVEVEFAVEDVTGDAVTDFTMVSAIANDDHGATGSWRKTGEGTMLLAAPRNYTGNRPVSVEAGRLVLGTSNGLLPGSALALAGGTIEFAANTVNTNESLTVTADSSLALADGATAVFGDSSAAEWAADARLTITGDPAACRVEFGAAGLTDAQLSQIRWMVGGKANRVQIGADGELVPYVPGLLLMVK